MGYGLRQRRYLPLQNVHDFAPVFLIRRISSDVAQVRQLMQLAHAHLVFLFHFHFHLRGGRDA